MKTITVEARAVKVGDRLYNNLAPHPTFRWVTVRSIKSEGDRVYLATSAWETIKHPREGVTIQRP